MTHCSLENRPLIEAYLSLRIVALWRMRRRVGSHKTEAKAAVNETAFIAVIISVWFNDCIFFS